MKMYLLLKTEGVITVPEQYQQALKEQTERLKRLKSDKKEKSEQMEEKGKEADTMEEELSSLEKKSKTKKEMTSSGANDQVHPVYRFNKFDELCSQLIKSFLREGSTIDCVHPMVVRLLI